MFVEKHFIDIVSAMISLAAHFGLLTTGKTGQCDSFMETALYMAKLLNGP